MLVKPASTSAWSGPAPLCNSLHPCPPRGGVSCLHGLKGASSKSLVGAMHCMQMHPGKVEDDQ